jgi:type I restriction enzyme M protein
MLPMQENQVVNSFTPQHVSKLIAQLAMHGQTTVNKIYDPAAGSGSLLIASQKAF